MAASPLALLAIVALLGAGCARNAVLELSVELPAAEPAAEWTHARVQVRRLRDADFRTQWAGADLAPVELDARATTTTLSVVTEDVDADLAVKVLFCASAACADAEEEVPAAWYTLEHPFYVGEYTAYTIVLDALPPIPTASTEPTEVTRCYVHGCWAGEIPTTTDPYCLHFGGGLRHLCEDE